MVDLTKPVQTRDGRPVRILATDRKSPMRTHPILGLVDNGPNTEDVVCWMPEGRYHESQEHHFDLVNVPPPPPVVVYANVYPAGPRLFGAYASRADADLGAGGTRVGCMRIVLEERFDD